MSWKKTFRCLIPCNSWKNIDGWGFNQRIELRGVVGKNEAVRIGPSVKIDTARAQEDPDPVSQADNHSMDGKWAAPRPEIPASWQSFLSRVETPEPPNSKQQDQ